MSSRTFYFEEVFDDYSTFKELTDQLMLYDDPVSETFNQWLFNILYLHFFNNSINYDVPDIFKMRFAGVYIDVFKKILKQKNIVDKIYNLTDDELTVLTETISNQSLNPNTKPTKYFDYIDYISAQVGSRVNNSKLPAYLAAIKNTPSLNLNDIYSSFEPLFLQIYGNDKYFFTGDNENDY